MPPEEIKDLKDTLQDMDKKLNILVKEERERKPDDNGYEYLRGKNNIF